MTCSIGEPEHIRLKEWKDFTKEVYFHIRDYTIPQYRYNDNSKDMTTQDFLKSIMRRCKRNLETNARGKQELVLDLIKIADEASIAWLKERDKINSTSEDMEHEKARTFADKLP